MKKAVREGADPPSVVRSSWTHIFTHTLRRTHTHIHTHTRTHTRTHTHTLTYTCTHTHKHIGLVSCFSAISEAWHLLERLSVSAAASPLTGLRFLSLRSR